MTPTEQFWWNWAVYAVTALATTLVAVLAIWGEKNPPLVLPAIVETFP
jgi:hypothetical protein